jgi:hypothetical protein
MALANGISRVVTPSLSNSYQNTDKSERTFGSTLKAQDDKKIAIGFVFAIPEALALGTEAIAWLWPIAVRTVGVAGAGAFFAYLKSKLLGKPQVESLTGSQIIQNAKILDEAKEDPNFQKLSPKIREAVEGSVMQASNGGKRAKNRERGHQREAKVATGSPQPPKKPNKKDKEPKTKNTKLDNVQKFSQPDQTPRPKGDWEIINRVKTYVGPEVTVAPQRPTTMPNSTKLNTPEPPTKWEIVDGIKRPVEPHTVQQQVPKPKSDPQNSIEREFWKTVDRVKTLVR